MNKKLSPLMMLGLAVLFYAIYFAVGSDTFIGSAFGLIGLLLLIFAIVGGVQKLVKR